MKSTETLAPDQPALTGCVTSKAFPSDPTHPPTLRVEDPRFPLMRCDKYCHPETPQRPQEPHAPRRDT